MQKFNRGKKRNNAEHAEILMVSGCHCVVVNSSPRGMTKLRRGETEQKNKQP